MPTGTHHATPSCATSEALIGPATSRVFARLAPGSVQAAAAAGLREPPGAVLAAPAAAGPDTQLATVELPPLPQPLAARPAAASTLTLAARVRLTKRLIDFVLLFARPCCADTALSFLQAADRLPGPQRQVRPPASSAAGADSPLFPARATARGEITRTLVAGSSRSPPRPAPEDESHLVTQRAT